MRGLLLSCAILSGCDDRQPTSRAAPSEKPSRKKAEIPVKPPEPNVPTTPEPDTTPKEPTFPPIKTTEVAYLFVKALTVGEAGSFGARFVMLFPTKQGNFKNTVIRDAQLKIGSVIDANTAILIVMDGDQTGDVVARRFPTKGLADGTLIERGMRFKVVGTEKVGTRTYHTVELLRK